MCACSVCLFLQNQDFRRQAEELVNTLRASGEEAASRLAAVNANLATQQEHVVKLAGSMGMLVEQQESLAVQVMPLQMWVEFATTPFLPAESRSFI